MEPCRWWYRGEELSLGQQGFRGSCPEPNPEGKGIGASSGNQTGKASRDLMPFWALGTSSKDQGREWYGSRTPAQEAPSSWRPRHGCPSWLSHVAEAPGLREWGSLTGRY